MQNTTAIKSKFKAGMYLLETLSSGMYNDPLTIYREYIQNAVDSIDLVDRRKALSVRIDLNPSNKKITFWDNGAGILSENALEVLSAIGSSNKIDKGMRGFRGIGRLGGLAFCEKATFRTKAYNETIESAQEWDCSKLRSTLSGNSQTTGTLKKLFDSSTKFYQTNSKRPKDSYFKVELEGVSSFRNYIFDLKRVHDYLAKTAPVPFNPDGFGYGKAITYNLNHKLTNYSTYNIFLNGHQVYKPYTNFLRVSKKANDRIDQIEFFDIKMDDEIIASGWYGKREKLLGAIAKGDKISGIRVRLGNILIGDEHLLDNCFRENRFNSYFIGEIHINSPLLIPNSRRDDFIDNDQKTYFYNAISREIGLPLSKEVRNRSQLYSENKKNANDNETSPVEEVKKTQFSLKNEESTIAQTMNYTTPIVDHQRDTISIAELKKYIDKNCRNCPTMKKLIDSFK